MVDQSTTPLFCYFDLDFYRRDPVRYLSTKKSHAALAAEQQADWSVLFHFYPIELQGWPSAKSEVVDQSTTSFMTLF